MSTAEVAKSTSTYDWLVHLPIASSAGSTAYQWYETSKNCCRISKFAVGTVESSAQYVAGAAAPIVKRLDGPIQAVDSFTLKQLERLEEKLPAIKKEPGEVLEVLTDTKDAVCNRLCEGKQAVYNRLNDGKAAISSTLASGKDRIYTSLEAGAEVLANTRAGTLVGSGVDCTLGTTEQFVDYLLPPEENEKELLVEDEKPEKTEEEDDSDEDSEEEEDEDEEDSDEEGEGTVAVPAAPSRFTRVKTLSRKLKLRMYYRTMRRLQTVQQQCKTTLDHLKLTVDVLKLAKSTRDGVGHQYDRAQAKLKQLESQLKSLLLGQAETKPTARHEAVTWLPEQTTEDDDDIQWLTPQKAEDEAKSLLQSALDYARELSKKVSGALGTVAQAASYLPHHLKDGAHQGYTKAQELYESLKAAKVPTDLPTATLNKISEVVETQLGYVQQLGAYISSALQRKGGRRTKEEAVTMSSTIKSDSDSEEEEEEDEQDPSVDPASSRPHPEQEST